MLKAILFDAADTLIYLPRPVGVHYREVALGHGFDLDVEKLNGAFRETWKAMPARVNSGRPRVNDDRDWWRELVVGVLDRLNAPEATSRRDEFFAAVYEHFRKPEVWAVFSEVPGVLEDLRKTHRLAIVSNFDGRLRDIPKGHGLLEAFSEVILSSEVGADKPDPAIFQAALERLGVKPSEALHVGDDPKLDWDAAEAAGLKTFRLDRPRNSLLDLVKELGAGELQEQV